MRRVACGWFDFLINQGSKPPGHSEDKWLFPLVRIQVAEEPVLPMSKLDIGLLHQKWSPIWSQTGTEATADNVTRIVGEGVTM